MAAAISGSASVNVAVKNESGAEPVLALVDEGLMSEISPPPQPVRQGAGGHVWRSKAALAEYHIRRQWPSACGASLLFVQDMVGMEVFPSPNAGVPKHLPRVAPALSRGPYAAAVGVKVSATTRSREDTAYGSRLSVRSAHLAGTTTRAISALPHPT